MAHTTKFLRPVRQSFTVITSSSPSTWHTIKLPYAKFEPLKTLTRDLQPIFCNRAYAFQRRLNTQIKYFWFSGRKLSIGSIFGVSVVLGSKSFWPHVAYSMDGTDVLLDDYCSLDDSDEEEGPKTFWIFARKLWLPLFLFLTVLTNLDNPIALIAMKIVLLLLSTNPTPLSVYVFVDQLCHQSMRQEPHLYKIKSLYAKKVEVQDYKLLCIARVELKNEKFTLVGILGGWWTLPRLLSQEAFSLIRNGALWHYLENSPKN